MPTTIRLYIYTYRMCIPRFVCIIIVLSLLYRSIVVREPDRHKICIRSEEIAIQWRRRANRIAAPYAHYSPYDRRITIRNIMWYYCSHSARAHTLVYNIEVHLYHIIIIPTIQCFVPKPRVTILYRRFVDVDIFPYIYKKCNIYTCTPPPDIFLSLFSKRLRSAKICF